VGFQISESLLGGFNPRATGEGRATTWRIVDRGDARVSIHARPVKVARLAHDAEIAGAVSVSIHARPVKVARRDDGMGNSSDNVFQSTRDR